MYAEKNGEVKPPYLTPDEATLCGLGIYSDTGSFGFSSTTKEDFEAAALLLTPEFGPMRLSDILDHQHKLTNVANTVTTAYGEADGKPSASHVWCACVALRVRSCARC